MAIPMTNPDKLLRRFMAHRWVLIATLLLFVVLSYTGLLAAPLAVFGVSFVACAAMLAPVKRRKERQAKITVEQPEAALQKSFAILNTIPDPHLILDQQGSVVHANSAFTSTFGVLENGASALLRFRSPDMQSMFRAAMSNKVLEPVELIESKPFERFFSVSARPLELAEMQNLIMVHFDDLTAAKHTERLRSDFIANASHELRTPLASLTGFIETLSGPARNDASARDRFLGIMQEQAERMSRLIDDLLTLSRFETGAGKAEFEKVNVSDVLEHVVDALRPMGAQIGTTIHWDKSALSEEAFVHGNRDELIQLFENLTENAIKYGSENGNVQIEVETLQYSDEHCITIRDDGPGISEEHLPRLVERFYRVDVETSRGKQGTGLGLSIVKHITQRHRGRLKINSSMGAGTAFVVTLPKMALENSKNAE